RAAPPPARPPCARGKVPGGGGRAGPRRARLARLPHDQLLTADREPCAELVAPARDLLERVLVVARIADIGLVALVVAHERERDLGERRVVYGEAREHADPVAVSAA